VKHVKGNALSPPFDEFQVAGRFANHPSNEAKKQIQQL
jgi:hypothetical protein